MYSVLEVLGASNFREVKFGSSGRRGLEDIERNVDKFIGCQNFHSFYKGKVQS